MQPIVNREIRICFLRNLEKSDGIRVRGVRWNMQRRCQRSATVRAQCAHSLFEWIYIVGRTKNGATTLSEVQVIHNHIKNHWNRINEPNFVCFYIYCVGRSYFPAFVFFLKISIQFWACSDEYRTDQHYLELFRFSNYFSFSFHFTTSQSI